jgi:hypothetical protein
MARAYLIYVLMFAALVGGLWAIFFVGRSLEAVRDISGSWTVKWDTVPPAGTARDHSTSATHILRIEQSGRFCTVWLTGRESMGMKIVEGAYPQTAQDDAKDTRLQGEGWTLDIAQSPAVEEFALVAISADGHTHRGTIRRTPAETVGAASGSQESGTLETADAGSSRGR